MDLGFRRAPGMVLEARMAQAWACKGAAESATATVKKPFRSTGKPMLGKGPA